MFQLLTSTSESRYGLGLPLALRPKVNLNKYSEVMQYDFRRKDMAHNLFSGQFCRPTLLHDGHIVLQSRTLSRISPHPFERKFHLSNASLGCAYHVCYRTSCRYTDSSFELSPRKFAIS